MKHIITVVTSGPQVVCPKQPESTEQTQWCPAVSGMQHAPFHYAAHTPKHNPRLTESSTTAVRFTQGNKGLSEWEVG